MLSEDKIHCDKVMQIKPRDNLFLGTGKNFNKTENAWLNTMLMPYPSVFYGAICSAMLANNEFRKKAYIYNKKLESDPRKYLKIKNIYLYDDKNNDVYIKAPLDLYINKKGEIYYGDIRKIKSNMNCSLEDISYLFFNSKKDENERCDGMFIKRNNFYNSYYYNRDSLSILKPLEIVENSYKVGIERDNNYVAKEGHLYRVDLTEFKDKKWSYLIEYGVENSWWKGKNNKILDKGYLKLGGENKVCEFYSYKRNEKLMDCSHVYDEKNHIGYVKMVLTSPCIFENYNWKPSFKNDIKVVAAATGKPYNLGGFDIVIRHPKPMYKVIPEGSVYILKSELFKGKSLKKIKTIIYQENIIKKIPGFGQFEIVPVNKYQMEGIEY
ncbi:type III-B CRISPR module-associated Cmr3 family protein [Clostridium cochlearium]|uniref:type III-B CRISPR module-associated Cmr3 family protein n=1 Tax=Clostridium cochlearium TaxID=1494 RepID=UPI001FA84351|nr:type III-B CRISPR module-associated Cmr3 family protein [Clostridium cochlearium]